MSPKTHKDSNGTNVVGRFGTDRYWVREDTDGGAFVMAAIIVYDAFDYRGDGRVRKIGSVGPRFRTKEAAEKHLFRILSKKQVVA